jgi:hypothetical protein
MLGYYGRWVVVCLVAASMIEFIGYLLGVSRATLDGFLIVLAVIAWAAVMRVLWSKRRENIRIREMDEPLPDLDAKPLPSQDESTDGRRRLG